MVVQHRLRRAFAGTKLNKIVLTFTAFVTYHKRMIHKKKNRYILQKKSSELQGKFLIVRFKACLT